MLFYEKSAVVVVFTDITLDTSNLDHEEEILVNFWNKFPHFIQDISTLFQIRNNFLQFFFWCERVYLIQLINFVLRPLREEGGGGYVSFGKFEFEIY